MRRKLLSLLVLLMTAATGAWAQGPWNSGDCTVTLSGGVLTVSKTSGTGAMANYTVSLLCLTVLYHTALSLTDCS